MLNSYKNQILSKDFWVFILLYAVFYFLVILLFLELNKTGYIKYYITLDLIYIRIRNISPVIYLLVNYKNISVKRVITSLVVLSMLYYILGAISAYSFRTAPLYPSEHQIMEPIPKVKLK